MELLELQFNLLNLERGLLAAQRQSILTLSFLLVADDLSPYLARTARLVELEASNQEHLHGDLVQFLCAAISASKSHHDAPAAPVTNY
jgi:hypothetical protein